MAKASVSFWSLIGMRLRKVDSRQIVTNKINAAQAGLEEITTNLLESHYLSNGRVPNVVRALIAAHRAKIPIDWSMAAAIDLINSHPYANGTAVFTRTGDVARTFASAIEVGMVGVNVPLPVPMAFYSFGGWRSSLFGDHHIYGMEGVRFYTKLKCVTQRWPTATRTGAEFTMPVMK